MTTANKRKLAVILGPTACGKTEVAIEIAKKIGGEIISADSMQVYRGFDIGTAKIKPMDVQNVHHHLIDIVDYDQPYSVADFQQQALQLISDINQRNKLPIMVGGTGLYISSVISPYRFAENSGCDIQFREQKQAEFVNKGGEYLHEQLIKIDPAAAAKIHPHDSHRLIRALEVYHNNGIAISSTHTKNNNHTCDFKLAIAGLTMERSMLNQKIEQRVDKMIASGLVQEVETLIANGASYTSNPMQSIGYRQIGEYIQGKISLEQAICDIKTATRRYAKRQYTWFKRDPRINWFDLGHYPGINELAAQIVVWMQRELEGE